MMADHNELLDPEAEGCRIVYTDTNERHRQSHAFTCVEGIGELAQNAAAIQNQFNATEFTVSVLEGTMGQVTNPIRDAKTNTDANVVFKSKALQVVDNGRGFSKSQTAVMMRNGYRGAYEAMKLFGRNNQGLKQVCSKLSPAWALHFSVSCDTNGEQWYTLLAYGSNFDLKGLLEYRTISWPKDVSVRTWRQLTGHTQFSGGATTAEMLFRSDGGKPWAPLHDLADAKRYFDKISGTGVLSLFPLEQPLQGEEQSTPQVEVTEKDIVIQGESLSATLGRYFVAPELNLLPNSYWQDAGWNGFSMYVKGKSKNSTLCKPYLPAFPMSDPIEFRVGEACHRLVYGPYYSTGHNAESTFPYKPAEGLNILRKNYCLHLCSNSRIMNRENPRFPEYANERVDYFSMHSHTAQVRSGTLLAAIMDNMCHGRQDDPPEPEQYQAFEQCLERNRVFQEDNPYLENKEYQRQMKNLMWLLGNPFEVLVGIDPQRTQVNDKKDDIIDDVLLRDIFYGSIQVEVAFDVLKRFEPGLNSIIASVDKANKATAAANAAAAAAAKRRRTELAATKQAAATTPQKVPAKKTAAPSKAPKPAGKPSKPAAAAEGKFCKRKQVAIVRSLSAESTPMDTTNLNALATLAQQKLDNSTPSQSQGTDNNGGRPSSQPEARQQSPHPPNTGRKRTRQDAATPHSGSNAPPGSSGVPARFGKVRTRQMEALQLCLGSGDSDVLGVFAKLATVENRALSSVLAHFYKLQLCTLVVNNSVCVQRLTGMLRQQNAFVPDFLPRNHCPSQPVFRGLMSQPGEQAQRLMDDACNGADDALNIPLPQPELHEPMMEGQLMDWPQGCLGYVANLVRPKAPGHRATLLLGMLGDTLVFETLPLASAYRLQAAEEVAMSVPDIITLDGGHISRTGIISGDNFKPAALEDAECRFGSMR